jgi:lysozyme
LDVKTMKLIKQLKRHEGYRRLVYECSRGVLTVGIGRNLESVGISEKEAEYLLKNDIESAIERLNKHDLLDGHDEVRQAVLINMAFNLGVNGLLKFRKSLNHWRNHEYDEFSKEILNSRWARQVGGRAQELSEQARTGKWQF